MNFNSEQELYEYIGEFLIKQGIQSKCANHCLYRGPNNTKCAVGCVITDEVYNIEYEGLSIYGIKNYKEEIPLYIIEYAYFLEKMQEFHDNDENWNENGLIIEKLIKFGKENNLNTSKFENL
jgi:hypothetical protein